MKAVSEFQKAESLGDMGRQNELASQLMARLATAELTKNREAIDKMKLDELKSFVRSNIEVVGSHEAVWRAYKRIEEQTAERIVDEPKLDCFWALNFAAQVRACSDLIVQDPANVKAIEQRASAYTNVNDFSAATRDLTSAIELQSAKEIDRDKPRLRVRPAFS